MKWVNTYFKLNILALKNLLQSGGWNILLFKYVCQSHGWTVLVLKYVLQSSGWNACILRYYVDAITIKWTSFDPYEGSTIQGSKLHIEFEFCKFFFYVILKIILFYKAKKFILKKTSSKNCTWIEDCESNLVIIKKVGTK
jgi:hypothetical protein